MARKRNPLFSLFGDIISQMIRGRCDLCGNLIKNRGYVWSIEGERKKLCPHCNRSVEQKKSRAATKRLVA